MDVVVILAIILIIVVIGLLTVSSAKRDKADKARAAKYEDRFKPGPIVGANPNDLGVNAMVEYNGVMVPQLVGQTLAIRGAVEHVEDGYKWHDYLVELRGNETGRCWFGYEPGAVDAFTYWEQEDFIPPGVNPGERELIVNGVVYRLKERGTSIFFSRGTTDMPANGSCEYIDYRASDGRLLAFEKSSGDEWEMAFGWPVEARQITIHPATAPL